MKWLVVGAGSGGCVAARRLHDAGHEVIVVEAGPPLTPGEVPRAVDGDDFVVGRDAHRPLGDLVDIGEHASRLPTGHETAVGPVGAICERLGHGLQPCLFSGRQQL